MKDYFDDDFGNHEGDFDSYYGNDDNDDSDDDRSYQTSSSIVSSRKPRRGNVHPDLLSHLLDLIQGRHGGYQDWNPIGYDPGMSGGHHRRGRDIDPGFYRQGPNRGRDIDPGFSRPGPSRNIDPGFYRDINDFHFDGNSDQDDSWPYAQDEKTPPSQYGPQMDDNDNPTGPAPRGRQYGPPVDDDSPTGQSTPGQWSKRNRKRPDLTRDGSEADYDKQREDNHAAYDVPDVPNPKNPSWESIGLALLPSLFGAGTRYLGPLTQGYLQGTKEARARMEAKRKEVMNSHFNDAEFDKQRGNRRSRDEEIDYKSQRKDYEHDRDRDEDLDDDLNDKLGDIEDSAKDDLDANGSWSDAQDKALDAKIQRIADWSNRSFDEINSRIRRPKVGSRSNKSIQSDIEAGMPHRTGNQEFDSMPMGDGKYRKARELHDKGEPGFADLDDDTMRQISQLPSLNGQMTRSMVKSRKGAIGELAKNRKLDVNDEHLEQIARETMPMDEGMASSWSQSQLKKIGLHGVIVDPENPGALKAWQDYAGTISSEKEMLKTLHKNLENMHADNPNSPDHAKWIQLGALYDTLKEESDDHQLHKPKPAAKQGKGQNRGQNSPTVQSPLKGRIPGPNIKGGVVPEDPDDDGNEIDGPDRQPVKPGWRSNGPNSIIPIAPKGRRPMIGSRRLYRRSRNHR